MPGEFTWGGSVRSPALAVSPGFAPVFAVGIHQVVVGPLAAFSPDPGGVQPAVRAVVVSVGVRASRLAPAHGVPEESSGGVYLPGVAPCSRFGVVIDEHPVAVAGAATPVAELQSAVGTLPKPRIRDADWLAVLKIRFDRAEQRRVPFDAVRIGSGTLLGGPVVKRMAVMVECQVYRPVLRAYSDGDDVVCVVAAEIVVAETNGLPVACRKSPPCQAHAPLAVVIADVLVPCMGYDGILLKRQAVDGLAESPLDRQRRGIDPAVPNLNSLELCPCGQRGYGQHNGQYETQGGTV